MYWFVYGFVYIYICTVCPTCIFMYRRARHHSRVSRRRRATAPRDATRDDERRVAKRARTFIYRRSTRPPKLARRDRDVHADDDDDDDDDAGARDGDAGDARRATRDVDSRRAMRATDAHCDASTLNASSARRDRVQRDEDGALVQPHEQEGFVGVRRARERATDEARSDPVPSRDDAEGGRDGERRE